MAVSQLLTAFNRTSLELKHYQPLQHKMESRPFNRTSLELKRLRQQPGRNFRIICF